MKKLYVKKKKEFGQPVIETGSRGKMYASHITEAC